METKVLNDVFAENIVTFSFQKKDGSIREAVGTTNLSVINASGGKIPVNAFDYEKSKNFPFFDLIKKEWRSISALSLETIVITKLDNIYGN